MKIFYQNIELMGIYHHVSVKHMQKYVDEFCFRLNHRECGEAFESLVNLAIAA